MIPYRIYLSGGGICAMAHVGALIELEKHISLRAVKEWMGVSAGSFVAMCICIGFTLDELKDFCVRFDFANIKEMDSVPGWILRYGMDTGERLGRLIDACLHVKGLSSDITFKECYAHNKLSLKIVAADLNDVIAKTFSPVDTPDYKVSYAVRASMTVPYYFQPFICPVSGHSLIDGGVISNYPLFVLPTDEHARTLSIIIRTSVEQKDNLEELGIDELIMRPLNMTIIQKATIESYFYDARCIQIQLGELNILNFSLEVETKNNIIEKGMHAVIDYFTKYPIPKRRHSIS
jgi:NTE family protein